MDKKALRRSLARLGECKPVAVDAEESDGVQATANSKKTDSSCHCVDVITAYRDSVLNAKEIQYPEQREPFPCGYFKGTPFCDVPESSLVWLKDHGTVPRYVELAEIELLRRETNAQQRTIFHEVIVHTCDRLIAILNGDAKL